MNRRLSAKRAWARLSERAELGEKFGFISCIALLYKAGTLTRAQVVETLNDAYGINGPWDLAAEAAHVGTNSGRPVLLELR